MARLIVMSEDHGEVLMDEGVRPLHLQDPHASLQILERMAWAVDTADLYDEAGRITLMAPVG